MVTCTATTTGDAGFGFTRICQRGSATGCASASTGSASDLVDSAQGLEGAT